MSTRKRVITAHNFVRSGYEFKKPSLTVPGQVLPIRSVLDRFRRGQSVQSFTPVYNPDFPSGYENMDKIERIEAARAQKAVVERMRRALSEKQKRDSMPEEPVQPNEPEAPEQ